MNLQYDSKERKNNFILTILFGIQNQINYQSTLKMRQKIIKSPTFSKEKNSKKYFKNFTKTAFIVLLYFQLIFSVYSQCDTSPILQNFYVSQTTQCRLKLDSCNNNKILKCSRIQCTSNGQNCLATMQSVSILTCRQYCCQNYNDVKNSNNGYALKMCKQNLSDASQNTSPKSNSNGLVLFVFFLCIILLFIIVVRSVKKRQKKQKVYKNGSSAFPPTAFNLKAYQLDNQVPCFVNANDKCAICLDQNINLRTHCNHFYHGKCLVQWLKKKPNNSCPLCLALIYNPVKIYCKQCHTGDKLVYIQATTSQTTINNYDLHKCENCKKFGSNSFSMSQQANDNASNGFRRNKDVLNQEIQQASQVSNQAPNSKRKRKLQKLKKSQNKSKPQITSQGIDQSQKQMHSDSNKNGADI